MNRAARITTTPATIPMTMAAHGCTKAQGAVIATSTGKHAVGHHARIGLLPWNIIQNIAETAPNAPAIAASAATTANRHIVYRERRRRV